MDFVFAVHASPVLIPEQHGATAPKLVDLPKGLREIVDRYRATTAGTLALRTYETRPQPQPAMRVPKPTQSVLGLLSSPWVLRNGARLLARFGPRRLKFGSNVLVFRWADAADVLDRDGDFRIAPINANRIEAVSGSFILGMDRSEELFAQRRAVYGALRSAGTAPFQDVVCNEPRRILEAAAARYGQVDVVNGYARPIAARAAAAMFGVRGPAEQDLMRVARAVFHETPLSLGGDECVKARGIAAGRELGVWIADETAARRKA
jgi:cytochrome P450